MKIQKILAFCLSVLFLAAAGCNAPTGMNAENSGVGLMSVNSPSSASQSPSSSSVPAVASAPSVSSEPISGNGETSSKNNVGESAASVTQASSKVSANNSDWVAYDTNKDGYKLHIRKKDGSEDKVIVNDIVLAPCVAGEWVYYLANLDEIDKVRLDGSQKTKVCDTDVMQNLNGNTAITAEYKDGYILYKTVQLHEVGNNSSYPAHDYKLDLDQKKITPVT